MPAVAQRLRVRAEGKGQEAQWQIPLSVPLEALSRNPRGWPQPGPFVLGSSGGSQFQFSRWACDRPLFVGEPAKCSSP